MATLWLTICRLNNVKRLLNVSLFVKSQFCLLVMSLNTECAVCSKGLIINCLMKVVDVFLGVCLYNYVPSFLLLVN